MNNKKNSKNYLYLRILLVVAILVLVIGVLAVIKYKSPDAVDDDFPNDSTYNYDPNFFQGTA